MYLFAAVFAQRSHSSIERMPLDVPLARSAALLQDLGERPRDKS